ncbi:hypothetical protein GALL_341890 [mine drainage metagenome]|uniref:NfeD-like C-terminal domain-containing protein n=1 Tax=mine drainage metagenome TaxID=410659 RepID=A0A1J5QVZ7_9ZZZZ
MEWLWWVAAALVLGVAEMLSLSLFLLMLAGGALAAGVASALGASPAVQFIIAPVVALALVLGLRPWLLRHLRERVPLPETNAGALVGRGAVVVSTVGDVGGRIKLNGEVWSARAFTEGCIYPTGAEVTVERIEGATAIVRDQSPTASSATEDTRGAAPR